MRLLLAVALALAAVPLAAQAPARDLAGRLEGVLRIPGEPAPFSVTLERAGDGWSAALAETVDRFPRFCRSTRESMARVGEHEPWMARLFSPGEKVPAIVGRHIDPAQHEYGDAPEEELWCAFQAQVRGTDYSQWFFAARTAGERPGDLGYWIGFKIAEAYARRVPDRRQATRDILRIEDPEAFLAASGYAERFRCAAPAR